MPEHLIDVSRHIDVLVAGMAVGDINITCPDTCHTGKGGSRHQQIDAHSFVVNPVLEVLDFIQLACIRGHS
jgi:hypothetical protein